MLIVIPTHMESARLPGKPLRMVRGRPLIERIVHEVQAMKLDAELVVATDSIEVVHALNGIVQVYFTHHARNGTERVALVALEHYPNENVIVNVQGDQLLLPVQAVQGAASCVLYGDADVGTAVAPPVDGVLANPHRVKALIAYDGQCVGFYRLLVGGPLLHQPSWPVTAEHIGVYAYTRDALAEWVRLPQTQLERALGLEQARPLEAGMRIQAAWTEQRPLVIDTEQDLRSAGWAFSSMEFDERER